MLKLLQEELPKLWTDELYSNQFQKSPSKYKDFDHALKHITKTLGKLVEMVEEADHSAADDSTVHFAKEEVEKYVADLVIVAMRLALKSPSGAFNLEKAILDRIEKKMGVRLK
jgi:hypothetical protein